MGYLMPERTKCGAQASKPCMLLVYVNSIKTEIVGVIYGQKSLASPDPVD